MGFSNPAVWNSEELGFAVGRIRAKARLQEVLRKLERFARRVREDRAPLEFWFATHDSDVLNGWCYLFCEIILHTCPELGFRPYMLRKPLPPPVGHHGAAWSTHWYLVDPEGWPFDPTISQFTHSPDFSKGRSMSRCMRRPSQRARRLAELANISLP